MAFKVKSKSKLDLLMLFGGPNQKTRPECLLPIAYCLLPITYCLWPLARRLALEFDNAKEGTEGAEEPAV